MAGRSTDILSQTNANVGQFSFCKYENFLQISLALFLLARPTLAIKIQPGAARDKYSLIPLFNGGKHSTYVHLNLNNYMRDYDKVNT